MIKFLVVFVAVAAGIFVSTNPMLFGYSAGPLLGNYTIYKDDAILNDELARIAGDVGDELDSYRNHCLRVLTFSKFFIPDFVFDDIPDAMDIVSMSLAYHDCALWTDKKLSYILPSMHQMVAHTKDRWTAEQVNIASQIIEQHHKITPYHGGENKTVDALVNAVRKADWADATMGILRSGMPASLLGAAYKEIPEAGFHELLAGLGDRLEPDSLYRRLIGQVKILRL